MEVNSHPYWSSKYGEDESKETKGEDSKYKLVQSMIGCPSSSSAKKEFGLYNSPKFNFFLWWTPHNWKVKL